MRGVFILLALAIPCGLAHPAAAQDPAHVAPTEPLTPEEQLKKFHLPPGFEIQLVAAEPDVNKPINLAFDARGRLFATQSVEYPYPAKEGTAARDRVGMLWDFGPDGKAKNIETYVDGLNIPIGVTPIAGGKESTDLLVYTIPHLLRCRDTDGDGRIDERTAICEGFGFSDTHGMVNNLTPWIDGWIYMCHGFANESAATGSDGGKIMMQSGNTFRIKPDGSQIEQFTYGQVNPFGLTFDELGNIFSTDCHTLPAYCLLRGAYYPSFGKPHDGLGYGPEMMRHSHGSTGLSGICYYAADHFPAEYRGTLFIGNPITNRINHDKLRWHGSTPEAIEQPDFLTCDDPWFRPVDLELGPDGALYIADFYNRIIGHYEVPLDHPGRDRERGRIWRIVYKGVDGKAKPPEGPGDLTTMDFARLLPLLGHSNLTVRTMAAEKTVEVLARQGVKAVPEDFDLWPDLVVRADKFSTEQRAAGLWIYDRVKGKEGLPWGVTHLLHDDAEQLVRLHLMKVIAGLPNWDESEAESYNVYKVVRDALRDENPFVRRSGADALGRHPHEENIAPLLEAWSKTPAEDTHLIHTIRMALRDNLAAHGMYIKVADMKLADDKANAGRLADVSLGIPNEHAAHFLLEYLLAAKDSPPRFAELLHHAVRHANEDDLPAAHELASLLEKWPRDVQAAGLLAYQRALQERGEGLPLEIIDWASHVAFALLVDTNEGKVQRGIELAQQLRLEVMFAPLEEISLGTTPFANLRPLAIDALVAVDAARAVGPLTTILGDAAQDVPIRHRAASALAGINNEPSRAALLGQLKAVSEQVALEIARGLSRTREGSEGLLAAVESGKTSARMLQDRTVLDGLGKAGLPDFEKRLAELTASLPPLDEQIAALIQQRRDGFNKSAGTSDASIGQAVFKQNCAACHKVGELGKKIGPELEGIGNRGLDRILEDVLDPSRNVDQAFRMTNISTTDGQSIRGLKLREEGEVVILADDKGQEVRVPASTIAEQGLAQLSPMPANVKDIVREEDFYHLVKFLLEQRQKAEQKE